jgi:dCTP deaminase
MLRADRIFAMLREGATTDDPLVITPSPTVPEDSRSSASVDLRLGTWFVSLRAARMTSVGVDAPGTTGQLTAQHYVAFGDNYVLHPRGFVLGVTLEWIRLPASIGAYVTGKSSWGRRGLVIATATGVHPGYTGCLALELTNVGELPIHLQPGMRICQLFLHEVTGEQSGSRASTGSQFVGYRIPVLGSIQPDEVAARLAAAAHPDDTADSRSSPGVRARAAE